MKHAHRLSALILSVALGAAPIAASATGASGVTIEHVVRGERLGNYSILPTRQHVFGGRTTSQSWLARRTNGRFGSTRIGRGKQPLRVQVRQSLLSRLTQGRRGSTIVTMHNNGGRRSTRILSRLRSDGMDPKAYRLADLYARVEVESLLMREGLTTQTHSGLSGHELTKLSTTFEATERAAATRGNKWLAPPVIGVFGGLATALFFHPIGWALVGVGLGAQFSSDRAESWQNQSRVAKEVVQSVRSAGRQSVIAAQR